MDKSNDLRVSKSSEWSSFDMLVYVAAIVYDQEYGPHEEDKEIVARIFKDTIPRKKRSPRSHRSSYSPTAWMRVIEEQISELQNPNSESEPSSSCVTQSKKRSPRSHRSSSSPTPWTRVIEEKRTQPQNPNSESEPSSSSCVTQSKKRRPVNVSEEEEERRVFKKRKIVRRRLETIPIQTTPPPEWLLNVMMREENGYNPKLISTRKLYKTDLNKIQARLAVPFKQVVNPDFLTEEERRIIDEQAMKIRKEGVSVDFFDPLLNKYAIDLRKWKMSGNWYYNFVGSWNDVVAANRFKVNNVFPLWSFRSGSGKLCFAQVPSLATNSNDLNHGGGSTSGESGHVNPLPDDSGHYASTSGECSQG